MTCRRCHTQFDPRRYDYNGATHCPRCGAVYYRRSPQQGQQRPVTSARPQAPSRQASTVSVRFSVARLVICILSFVIALYMFNQIRLVAVVNALGGNSSDFSGGAGTILAILMIVAGITGIVGRNKTLPTLVAGIAYIVGAIIGFIGLGTYGDLIVWSILALIFGIFFVLASGKLAVAISMLTNGRRRRR